MGIFFFSSLNSSGSSLETLYLFYISCVHHDTHTHTPFRFLALPVLHMPMMDTYLYLHVVFAVLDFFLMLPAMQMISDVISSPCTAWVNYLNLFQSINKKVNSLKQFLQWFKKVNGFLKEKKKTYIYIWLVQSKFWSQTGRLFSVHHYLKDVKGLIRLKYLHAWYSTLLLVIS